MTADTDLIIEAAMRAAHSDAVRDFLEDTALREDEPASAYVLLLLWSMARGTRTMPELVAGWDEFRRAVRARAGLAEAGDDEAAIQFMCAEIDDAYRQLCNGGTL